MEIGKRLLAAADFAKAGERAADVGCDHGKLSAYLVINGICPFVSATDIREKPLEKARLLFKSLNIEDKTRVLLTDGLSGVPEEDAQTVFMAGMGFDSIVNIIEKTAYIRRVRLVLLPASKTERLRAWLWENGFELERERAVCENGKFYCVIQASFCGRAHMASAAECFAGSILPCDGGDAVGYLKDVLRRVKRVENARLGAGLGAGEYAEAREYIEGLGITDGT